MKKAHIAIIIVVLIGIGIGGAIMLPRLFGDDHESKKSINERIKLPEPRYDSSISIEQALLERRSVRAYQDEPLTLSEVAQLLWSAQGISDSERRFRTVPSAGALYPLEVYVVIGNVEGIAEGVYKYKPDKHELVKVRNGDVRDKLAVIALGQTCVRKGAIVIVFSAVYERTTRKRINEQLKDSIKPLCPVLMRGVVEEIELEKESVS